VTNKFATVLCACLIAIAAMAHTVRAEEYEDVPVDPPIKTVEETPAPEDPVSDAQGPARVPVEIDAAALAEALTEALATPTPDPDAEPTPEPTPQIIVIQATPETAPSGTSRSMTTRPLRACCCSHSWRCAFWRC